MGAQRCEPPFRTFLGIRIAGEFDDAPQEAESERERPMRLWLARMDDTPYRYPTKLEASTGFGTIRGRLLYFRETMK